MDIVMRLSCANVDNFCCWWHWTNDSLDSLKFLKVLQTHAKQMLVSAAAGRLIWLKMMLVCVWVWQAYLSTSELWKAAPFCGPSGLSECSALLMTRGVMWEIICCLADTFRVATLWHFEFVNACCMWLPSLPTCVRSSRNDHGARGTRKVLVGTFHGFKSRGLASSLSHCPVFGCLKEVS